MLFIDKAVLQQISGLNGITERTIFLLWIIFYNPYILPLPALAPACLRLLGLWWPLCPGDLCLQSPENIRNQTQDKPNANRGLPIKLVNHIQLQLRKLHWKSSWTPTSQNADGAPPYWGFECHVLTHCGLVIAYHYLGQIWLRLWLVVWGHQAVT